MNGVSGGCDDALAREGSTERGGESDAASRARRATAGGGGALGVSVCPPFFLRSLILTRDGPHVGVAVDHVQLDRTLAIGTRGCC